MFLFVNVIYSKQSTCKGGSLSESYEKGFMDLSLRVDEDSTEEEDEAADGEDKSGYELDIIFHKVKICKKDTSQRVVTPKKDTS